MLDTVAAKLVTTFIIFSGCNTTNQVKFWSWISPTLEWIPIERFHVYIYFGNHQSKSVRQLVIVFQALRVETANPLNFSAYIIRLRYKVADFVV